MTQDQNAVAAKVALFALATWAIAESAVFAGAVTYDHDAWLAIATALVMLVAALVSSVAGFAFCALAGSALAWLGTEPVKAVEAMVLCSIANQLYAVWAIREAIRWKALLPMLAAGTVTIPFGVWLLLHVDAAYYGTVFRDALAGALGGITGGLAGIPGSAVTIWCGMRGWDKLKQRAVYQPYILTMQIVTILCLRFQSPIRMNLAHDLRFVPFAVLGAMGGLAVFRRLTNNQFQLAVSVLLAVSGVGLLARIV